MSGDTPNTGTYGTFPKLLVENARTRGDKPASREKISEFGCRGLGDRSPMKSVIWPVVWRCSALIAATRSSFAVTTARICTGR